MKHLLHFYLNLRYKNKLITTCILVGIIPLTLLGLFCYYQTIHLLLGRERTALSLAVGTAYNSVNYQVQTYENLLSYLTHSDIIVKVPSTQYQSIMEKYEMLSYEFDVLIKDVATQHPEIDRITLYADRTDLYHGSQLRPLSDLETESWYDYLEHAAKPIWHLDREGYLCLIQKIPNPFIDYITSYSSHCLCIRLRPEQFFDVLTDISSDYHLIVADGEETFYEYTSPSIEGKFTQSRKTTEVSGTLSNNWIITLEKPFLLLALPANRMVGIVFLIILVCIFLIYTVSNLLSEFFAQKVNLLLATMQQVEKGDFSSKIHDDCPDEMGQLTNSFQHMIEELNRLVVEDYKNKITLKETQLMALQAQINPHFLYNCLSQINSKALINNQSEISQMAQLLSTFYRTTLNKGRSETLVVNEIKNVKAYIDIQRILNDNVFDAAYQIDEQLPEQEIPNLLLQPLVENAIVHGILPNKTRHGNLFLTISVVNGLIHFTVMDNGLGIPPEKIPLLTQTQSSGYGLKNVHERLLLTYGENHGLKINSIPDQSTMITFTIPVSSQKH